MLPKGGPDQAVLQGIQRGLQRLIVDSDAARRRDAGPAGVFVGVIERQHSVQGRGILDSGTGQKWIVYVGVQSEPVSHRKCYAADDSPPENRLRTTPAPAQFG